MRYSIALLLFAVTACHNSKLGSDVRKNLLESRDDGQYESGPTDAEKEVAIEPTSVGGAFLICADDPSLSATASHFGCRIEDERGEKLSGFEPKDSDVIALHLETIVPGKALRESDAFWHWTFAYQTADRAAYLVKFLSDMTILSQREAKVLDQHPIQRPTTKPATQSSPDPVVTVDSSHIIFVTSLGYRTGGTNAQQFNSLQAADAICNAHAQAAKLAGSFKAVLSTSNASARDRMALSGPIKLTNGSIIANRNVFWSTSHSLPILLDEAARRVDGGSVKVWSGTLETGATSIAETCNDWTDSGAAAKARYGLADKADVWISDGQESCDQSLRLYCIN